MMCYLTTWMFSWWRLPRSARRCAGSLLNMLSPTMCEEFFYRASYSDKRGISIPSPCLLFVRGPHSKMTFRDSLQPPSLQSNPLSRCHLTYYTIHQRDNVGASLLVFLEADNTYFLVLLTVRKKKFLSSWNLRNCNFLLSYHLLIFM